MTGPPVSIDNPRDRLAGARAIGEGVYVFTSGAYALNSGVVLQHARAGPAPTDHARTGPARTSILIDPGYFPGELERIAAFLDSERAEVSHIVLTHSDWDHVVGPPRWPSAAVVASSEFPARVAAEGERIGRSLAEFDRRLYVARPAPFAVPAPATLVGSPSGLVWDGPRVRLLPAGGHTADGLMVLAAHGGVLFSGDYLSDREIPFVGDSIGAYQRTLLQVRNMVLGGEVETLVPGHGDVCARAEILARIDEDIDYLARLDAWVRETRRVVDTIEGILERCSEVVFRKGWDNPDVHAEHRASVALLARQLGSV